MVKEQAGRWVVPNPQIPRSFGLMNITFGILLLLTAVAYGLMYAYTPALNRFFSAPMKQIEEQQKADRAAKIAALKAREAAAKTEEEKTTLANERAALEARVVPDLSAFDELQDMNAYNEPRLAIFYILDVSTALILNVLMIVSGGGLMRLREWARRLAIWVAQLKILRWSAMVVGSMVVIMPMMMAKTQPAITALEAQIKAAGGGASSVLIGIGHAMDVRVRPGLHDLRGDRRVCLSGDDVVESDPAGCACRMPEAGTPTRATGAQPRSGKQQSEPRKSRVRPPGRHRVPPGAGAWLAVIVSGRSRHAAGAWRSCL